MILLFRTALVSGLVVAAASAGPSAISLAANRLTDVAPTSPVAAPVPADWVLLGSAQNGRALIVAAALPNPTTCVRPEATLVKATRSRIELRMDFVEKADVGPDSVCPTSDVDLPRARLTVQLGRRLAGQAIGGPGKTSADRVIARSRAGAAFHRVESMAGLRVRDARPILRAWGLGPERITVKGPRGGFVTAQEPALPRAFRRPFDVVLTTRSTTDPKFRIGTTRAR